MPLPNVILKKGREKSVLNYHPWLFSGAIGKVDIKPEPGEIVRICDYKKNFLAYGYYNSKPQIQARILEWNENSAIDDAWWHDKIADSIARRRRLAESDSTDSYRLIFSESDGLPGLIVDKYADYLVLQSLTAGIDRAKQIIVESLAEQLKPSGIYERSDAEIRKVEGLPANTDVVYGEKPPSPIVITENNLKFYVDILSGQKSGFYLDQRDNRMKIAGYASGLDILDCFCYTGAFSIYALKAGAKSVTMVDSSPDCLAFAGRNIELNDLDSARASYWRGDIFEYLRQIKATDRRFDMVILDPPKFAKSKAQIKKALAGYKDINMLAMEILNPGGILATFSCSGAVDNQTLKTVLFWAAVDTSKPVQLIDEFHQGPDHPRLATFPEADYLGGFLGRVS